MHEIDQSHPTADRNTCLGMRIAPTLLQTLCIRVAWSAGKNPQTCFGNRVR